MKKDETLELIDDFILESSEIAESLDQDLVELENRPDDLELLNKIFRGAHTIKGSSSFLGFDKMSTITHHAEEILNKLRKGTMKVNEEIMDGLLDFVDTTKKILNEIKTGQDSVDISLIVEKLDRINSDGISTVGIIASSKSNPAHVDNKIEEASINQIQPIATAEVVEKKNSKNDYSKLGESGKSTKALEQTIRVDVSRLDTLMNLVGELVLGRNRIAQISGDLEKKFENEYLVEQLTDTTSQIGLITTELQLAVMKTRMLPVGKTFNKFPRMVRDLSKEKGKEVDLIITGEETELDKSVVEEINDPLIHMLRNAIDHGIEKPNDRVAQGKSSRGTVWLSAYHEGNHIVIQIKDDGKGMDPDIIRRKAIEKGVITKDEAANLDRNGCFGLIFFPGFSTAEVITNTSGRGVGMDVVKTNIEQLNGIISIESLVGVGTTFQLKLPLTLAIIQALFVEVAGENFAIPLMSVIETVRINIKEVHNFEGRELLKLRDTVLSLVRLDEIFDLESSDRDELYVVIVAIAEKRIGIIVENLIGQEEIVIKSLGDYLGGNQGVAGATIMGDGRVRLIIDVSGLMELAQTLPRKIKKKKSNQSKGDYSLSTDKKIKLIYVDDSATDRKIMRRLLESSKNIELTDFSSPRDVIPAVSSGDYDIIITDIMMADMDGYELTRQIRNRGLDLPIIAVSSRAETSDRKKILAAGVNAFVAKPVSSAIILEKIDELVNKNKV